MRTRWQEWLQPGPGDCPSGDKARSERVLPADSPGAPTAICGCARSEPSTTISQGKAKEYEEVSQVDLELRKVKTKDTQDSLEMKA